MPKTTARDSPGEGVGREGSEGAFPQMLGAGVDLAGEGVARVGREGCIPSIAGGCAGSSISLEYKLLGKQGQNFLLNCARDAGFFFVDVNIHFAADSELGQVDSRFDGVAGFGDQVAGVVGFEAIHVDAVAVHRLSDAVAGAMKEIFAVACFFYDATPGVVDLPAL